MTIHTLGGIVMIVPKKKSNSKTTRSTARVTPMTHTTQPNTHSNNPESSAFSDKIMPLSDLLLQPAQSSGTTSKWKVYKEK